jgi:nuclear transcription factor Y, gamma
MTHLERRCVGAPDLSQIFVLAPIIFAKACESQFQGVRFIDHLRLITSCVLVFIQEVTSRAWIIAEQAKRRTLSRADIARALQRSDQFDFLIDIVPRELANEKGRSGPRRNTEGEEEGVAEEEEQEEGGQGSGHELDSVSLSFFGL